MNNYRITTIFFLLLVSANITFSQNSQKITLIDDGSGKYAAEIARRFLEKPNSDPQKQAFKPFILGFYGFKTKTTIYDSQIGKPEALQLGINRLVLGTYDKEIDSTLSSIIKRANDSSVPIEATELEKKKIGEFVLDKHGYNSFKSFAKDVKETKQWQNSLGFKLGELAAYISLWYIPSPVIDEWVVSNLKSITTNISNAPADTPTELLNNLRKLNAYGNKTKFTLEEKIAVGERLKETLFSTLDFKYSTNSQVIEKTENTTQHEQLSPNELAHKHFWNGIRKTQKGDFQNAIKDYDKAIELNSNSGEYYFRRAFAYGMIGNLSSALRDYNSAINYKFSLPETFYNRGLIFYRMKSYQAAIWDFDKSLELNTENYSTFYNRGITYFQINEYEKAYTDFSQAIKLNPKHTKSYIMRAKIACKKGLIISATKDQNKAIELGGKVEKGCK